MVSPPLRVGFGHMLDVAGEWKNRVIEGSKEVAKLHRGGICNCFDFA